MRTLLTAFRDVWCAVTDRCRISSHDDPLLDTLRAHERAAHRAANASRQRQDDRASWLAARYTGQWEGNQDA